MTDDKSPLAAARRESVVARRQLSGTLAELQARLNPKSLAREAAQELREAGGEIARGGLQTLKRNPLTIAVVAAAIGLFVARRPLRALIAKAADETPPAAPRLPPKTRIRGRAA